MTPAPPSRSDWIHRPEADLFSEANLEAVRTAFRRPSGVVFGWQYFYAGGSSRSAIAFTAYDQYLHHIERARLGDHFTLFELDALLDRAVVHIGDIHSTGRLALDEPVIDLADEDAEVLIVRRFVGPLTRAVDATVTELPGTSDERLEQFKRDLVWGRGELVIFDQRVFDEDEHGGLVSTVTAQEGRRINALVDAQRPSPEGTVPLAGPYLASFLRGTFLDARPTMRLLRWIRLTNERHRVPVRTSAIRSNGPPARWRGGHLDRHYVRGTGQRQFGW